MTTLHIEHRITDLATWSAAFSRFGEKRRQAGVLAARVHHPADDSAFIVIDLDFETRERAASFLQVLETQIWGVPANSPALVGSPQARFFEAVDVEDG